MDYVQVINGDISLKVMTNSLPTKGKLVYEYNPLRNYRLSENKYLYKENYYSLKELKEQFSIFPDSGNQNWIGVPATETDPILYEKGQLIDFVTDELKFSISNPVHIVPQYSYDGSVNLILNDGINIPRLINSRFSATGKNTYEIIDRKGNNDTNIYDQGNQFDIDTSLYKRVTKIPKLLFQGVQAGGNLKVGNYHFYFKFSDADGNETDFVAESGLVSIFIGFDDPSSIHTGQKNENSTKQVRFQLSNIDSAYNYVSVYYSRSTAESNENSILQCAKVEKRYTVNDAQFANIVVTGFEDITEIAPSDINLQYNIVDAVGTSAVCQNMLFMANVHKPEIAYEKLQDLSLRFLPYLKEVNYTLDIDQNYSIVSTNKGYYDPQFIYQNTGYWGNELYRFGIVYILPNNELTPVFNIRGREKVGTFDEQSEFLSKEELQGSRTNDGKYNHFFFKKGNLDTGNDVTVQVKEDTGYILIPEADEGIKAINGGAYENSRGVVSLDPSMDTDKIYALDVRVDNQTIQELKKYVKGYFFVRQKRIPTILAQGITIGVDKVSNTPTIPTCNGFLSDLSDSLDTSYVETSDINGINYISEGFLSRYLFQLKKKSSSIWSSIGKIFAVTALITAVALGSIATFGGVAVSAVALSTGLSYTAFAITGTAITAGIVGTAAATLTAVAASIDEGIKVIQRSAATKVLKGRYTEVPSGYKRVEKDESRKVGGEFINRIIIKDESSNNIQGVLCPDYEINQPYFNQIFTGNKHLLRTTISQGVNILTGYNQNYFSNDDRHFYMPSYYDTKVQKQYECKVCGVPDNTKLVGIDSYKFRSRAGEAEEAFRYEQVGQEYTTSDDIKINSDIIRGSFGPYLAVTDYPNNPAETVEILVPGYNGANIGDYIQLRANDKSSYFSISDRISLEDQDNYLVIPLSAIVNNQSRKCGYKYELYRGDCYICQVTHRVIRNFNDPSAPYNDDIVDSTTWKENFDPNNTEKYEQINLGDINAVELGMWVTFKIRSSNNLNIRTIDNSYVDEAAMTGNPRGFFPYSPMTTEGCYKIPESQIYNKGFSKSLSERWNFELPDVPYIKNWFGTRIMYSDIHVNDAYKNGFRVFQGTHYRDYTREYGEIVKLVSLESNLLCVFEHGVALIPVNERAVAGEGAGGNIYINTSNVLPENPKIISDMFGSQWPESILKVPGKTGDSAQYVYGVDTVAKKIWRTDGNTLTCISDFRVQEFLNKNITLGERELTPKIGIRNVKTVYNAFKRDVLFTFYDNTYGFEEKVWNLCWNELLQKFITFYSWVPSHMENINNMPFSFDRNTSKWIAKLGTSHTESSFADGITLSNVIIENLENKNGEVVTNFRVPVSYINKRGEWVTTNYSIANDNKSRKKYIGVLSLSNRILPDSQLHYQVSYSLQRDQYGNYKKFEIVPLNCGDSVGGIYLPDDAMFAGAFMPLYCLKFKEGGDEYTPVFYKDGQELTQVSDGAGDTFYTYQPLYTSKALLSELYYRNKAKHVYADYDTNKIKLGDTVDGETLEIQDMLEYPIFKDITGKRPTLPREEMLNADKIVTLLNIKATISIVDDYNASKLSDAYYNMKAGFQSGTSLIDGGYYESVVGIAPRWNLQFLSTDFWKHGQAGLIDIADDIYPTYWYGRQHPFEFECVVVNDPSIHKIFTNLEIVANKAKPESFHYEIIGETYDFAKDKVNMYFRQEAMKALWQYNGADISYDRNFLKVQPRQQPKSADFPHKYYTRQDTINEIEDYYIHVTYPDSHDYRHLSGAEVVYYPNRQEYRIWNHAMAVDIDDLSQDDSRSIISANCQYLEDRWKVTINPILVCYKNEYQRKFSGSLIQPQNSTWAKAKNSSQSLPTLPIYNSPIPDQVLSAGGIDFPGNDPVHPEWGEDNALYNLYDLSGYNSEGNWKPLDLTNWLDDVSIYRYNFGEAQNRKELDVKDKFLKIRIRYSGEELAVIDFLNTVYRISYA